MAAVCPPETAPEDIAIDRENRYCCRRDGLGIGGNRMATYYTRAVVGLGLARLHAMS
jgi:hypothetical protein